MYPHPESALYLFVAQATEKIQVGCGLPDIEIPIWYEFPAGSDYDKEQLKNYVYGPAIDFGPDLHIVNHLIRGGLANPLEINEELKSFLKVSVCLKDHVSLTILFEQCPHLWLHDGLEVS